MAGLFGTRAQISPIKQTAIQPTGIPGSTFVRPVQREVGGNAMRLAESLGSLNSALQNFASVSQAEKDDPNARANKEQVARLQQMNREQLAAEIASGSLDGQRVQQDAAELLLAERANDDLRTRWAEFYNTDFDRSTGDAAAEFERIRQEVAAGLPSDVSKGHLYRLSHDFSRTWMEKDAEEKIANVKGEIATTVVGSFRATIDDAIGINGKSAKDAARMVFEKSAANRVFLGMSGQEQNDTIFAIAEEYALKGQVDVARELLSGDRVGADGRKVPSLMSTREFGTKALKLIKQAEGIAEQEFMDKDLNQRLGIEEKVRNGEFTPKDVEELKAKGIPESYLNRQALQSEENRARIFTKAGLEEQKADARRYSQEQENEVYSQASSVMARMGGITRLRDMEVPNAEGTGTKTITKEQQIDHEVSRREAEWDAEVEQMIQRGADPEQTAARVDAKRLDWYAGNRIKNEAWDNLLNGFAGRAPADTVLQGGETVKYLVKNAELYRNLKAGNASYLRTFLNDRDSLAMLDHYDRLVTRNHMPPEEALRFAASWNSKKPWERITDRALSAKDEQDLVDDLVDNLDLEDRSSDREYITGEVRWMAENENMTLDEIKRELPKRLEDSTVVINGVLVPDHRDLPDDFPPLMEERLAEIHTMIAARRPTGADPTDLYVRPVSGQSKWEVVSKSTGGTGFYILPKDLGAIRERKSREQGEIAEKLRSAKGEEREKAMADYQASIEADRQSVLKWEKRAQSRPTKLNKWVASQLRDNLNERIANDLTVSERAEAERAKGQKWVEDEKRKGQKIDRAVSSFIRSLIPSVKVGDTMLIGR